VAMVVHNHAHTAVFRSRRANRALNLLLYLESGMMVAKFHLHHNCGHHLHYTDPQRDPSTCVKNGGTMGRLEYIARYYVAHSWKSVRIGRDHPRLLRRYWEDQALAVAALAILFAVNWVNTLILVLAPMTMVWLAFINFTYDDHVGLTSKDDFEASHSKTHRLLNVLIFNNGYHLAHHVGPGIHWADLPDFHERIAARIRVPSPHTALNALFR
jgi:beta-carotene hydroxylase